MRVAVDVVRRRARRRSSSSSTRRRDLGRACRRRGSRSGSATISPHALARVERRDTGPGRSSAARGGTAAARAGESVVMSSPSKRTVPLVGSSSRTSSRPSVDLPQPDSPTSPSVSPRRTSSETPSTACTTCATRSLDGTSRAPESARRARAASSSAGAHAVALDDGVSPCSAPRAAGSRWQASRTAAARRARRVAATSSSRASNAYGQRGWNGQPGGSASGRAAAPGIAAGARPVRRPSRGIESSRPRVYGCCGSRKIGRLGPPRRCGRRT